MLNVCSGAEYGKPESGTAFTVLLPLADRRIRLLKAPRERRRGVTVAAAAEESELARGKGSTR